MKKIWSKVTVIGVIMGMLMIGATGCQNSMSAISGEAEKQSQVLNESTAEVLEDNAIEMTKDSSVVGSETINKLEHIHEIINTNFYFGEEPQAKQEGMLRGYVEGLNDEYSAYYTTEEYSDILEEQAGEYISVGLELYPYANEMTVMKVYGPAKEMGIRLWDVLTEVNGENITYEDIYTENNILSGEEGEEVTITVFRPSDEKEYTFTMQRQRMTIPTVEYQMLENQIGYIQVSHFWAWTSEEYRKAIVYLNAQGMEGLIVDIRNNGGGTMKVACNMLDYMLPEGIISYGKDKDGNVVQEYNSFVAYQFDKPLVILVNGYSASASEAFAGAIKDYGVGTIIGETTFGKGIGQQFFPLEDGSAVKLTTFEFFTPKGNRIHSVGIEPDVEVELDVEACRESGGENDNQLQAAIDNIMSKIGK